MIDPKIQKRLDKVMQLIERGASAGEKEAAREAFNRIIDAHDLSGKVDMESGRIERVFIYKGMIEIALMTELMAHFEIECHNGKRTRSRLYMDMGYLDYIQIECAFSYFRVHMRKQWEKICLPVINRKRTAKSKKATRDNLLQWFIPNYCHKSEIGKWKSVANDAKRMSKAEIEAALLMNNVEGGRFHTQVSNEDLKLLNS